MCNRSIAVVTYVKDERLECFNLKKIPFVEISLFSDGTLDEWDLKSCMTYLCIAFGERRLGLHNLMKRKGGKMS